jgi:hypothetical protein
MGGGNMGNNGTSGGDLGRAVGAKEGGAGAEYALGATVPYWYRSPESTHWQPIPGVPGSELGDCLEVRRREGTGFVYSFPSVNTQGYLAVAVGGRRVGLHRLVALMAYGPGRPGEVVRHLDGDPTNNHPSNLAYGTPRDNVRDSFRLGRRVQNRPRLTR